MPLFSKTTKAVALFGISMGVAIAQASAEDIFSFFGGFDQEPAREQPVRRMPYATDGGYQYSPRAHRRPSAPTPRVAEVSQGQSYCVRTCDGRFFPIASSEGSSARVATCKSMCPSSETKVYSGSSIESAAATDNGKPYSALPNAFRFRKELVAGCSCNGKDQLGLTPIKIENDPTLRKGDIVAGAQGLMISRPSDRPGAAAEFTPASRAIKAQFERPPVLASSDR